MVKIRSSQDIPDYAKPTTALCERFGFKWSFDFEAPIAPHERRLQIREDRHLNPPTKVAEIRGALQRGEDLKPVIQTQDGYIVDGNTTSEAGRREKRPHLPTVILDVSYEQARDNDLRRLFLLGAAANARHGVGIDRSEMRHALMEAGAGTDAIADAGRVAAMIGVTDKAVRDIVAEARAEHRAKALGLNMNGGLTANVMKALGRADRLNDGPWTNLVKLAVDSGMGSTEVQDVVKRMAEVKSDDGQIQVVVNERESRAPQIAEYLAGGHSKPAVSAKMRQRLGFIAGLQAKPDAALERNPDMVGLYLSQLRMAVDVLNKIIAVQEASASLPTLMAPGNLVALAHEIATEAETDDDDDDEQG